MREKKAWIFDLYGTLVDIWTDEYDPALWNWLAGFYRCYGSLWSADGICSRYHRLVVLLEEKIRREKGWDHPEIELGDVFAALLYEGLTGMQPDDLGKTLQDIKAQNKEFIFAAASGFRVFSRKRLSAYDGAAQLLTRLAERGCKVFLLSNAQALFTVPELIETGLDGLFDAVYLSSDKGMKKPQPEFMQLLLSEQGLRAEDCIMVGNDFQSDIAAAASAGMDSVFINSFNYSRERIAAENVCGALVLEDISRLAEIVNG